MENEKLIAAMRYCNAVVNDTENTGRCNFCPYRDHCSDLDNEAADALERLTAESAEKDAEIGRLTNLAQDAQKQWKAEYAMRRKFEADRDRLQAELDAAVEDLNGTGACFTCKHFRRNGGDCFGAGRCRLDGIEIWPCNEPGVYRVEVPDDGRKMYEWRGPQEAGNGVVE
ncbi:hypothetical protein [Oscillibacter ruminantium]|uniref:hypothetical protein n=1 Tax=Oscillibacter ruminantium TaxID=1263547 RepID=UPI000310B9C4|nr:hypothetical protein [Oscillibacter ruminantium]